MYNSIGEGIYLHMYNSIGEGIYLHMYNSIGEGNIPTYVRRIHRQLRNCSLLCSVSTVTAACL